MPKQISLKSNEYKNLMELLDRGLAYTDMYYKDSTKMQNLFNKVKKDVLK
jgi:hypothetical protein